MVVQPIYVSDLVGNLEYRYSHDAAHIIEPRILFCFPLQFAEKHLKSQDMIHITVDDLSIARKQIASKIMLFEGN